MDTGYSISKFISTQSPSLDAWCHSDLIKLHLLLLIKRQNVHLTFKLVIIDKRGETIYQDSI